MKNNVDVHQLVDHTTNLVKLHTKWLAEKLQLDLDVNIKVTNPTGDYVTGVNVEIRRKENAKNFYNTLATFSLTYLPSCAAVIVFHAVSVYPTYRNKGIGKALHELRIEIAKASKCSLAMATVDRDNFREQGILTKNGWVKSLNFASLDWDRQGFKPDQLTLWTKTLVEMPKVGYATT